MSLTPDTQQPHLTINPWLDLTGYVVNGWNANAAWPFLGKIDDNGVQLFLSTRMGTGPVVAQGLPDDFLPPRNITLLGYQRTRGAMQLRLTNDGVLEIAPWEDPRLDGSTASQLSLNAGFMRRKKRNVP